MEHLGFYSRSTDRLNPPISTDLAECMLAEVTYHSVLTGQKQKNIHFYWCILM